MNVADSVVVRRTSRVVRKSPESRMSSSFKSAFQPLSFRAKKRVRLRTTFSVEESAVFSARRNSALALITWILAFGFFACSFTIAAQVASGVTGANKQLGLIEDSLTNGAVSSIEILHMPDRMETRASVTPQNLEKWFDSKIAINRVNEWNGRNNLVKVLRATTLTEAPRMADMRSAIIFKDADGRRIGALYVGRFFGNYVGESGGSDGAIGDIPVKFEGGLSAWLKEMIPTTLR